MGANGVIEGVNRNVKGANGGAPDFSTIIAKQLQNLLPAMLAQLKTELCNHAMVRDGHATYTDKFHELARLVPHLVTPEIRKIERYVYGLAPQIRRMVAVTEPKTMQKAVQMDQLRRLRKEEMWGNLEEIRALGAYVPHAILTRHSKDLISHASTVTSSSYDEEENMPVLGQSNSFNPSWISEFLVVKAGGNLSETALEDNLLGCLSIELVALEAEIDLSARMDLRAETGLPAGMGLLAETDLPEGMGVLEEEANFFPVDLDEQPAEGLEDTGGVLPREVEGYVISINTQEMEEYSS
nr:reverse transcriptase domain-containing protein [Tanacetum cinerariifolium]